MGRENQATIKDVAKRAGVSVASAGRALGNYGKISDETKQKVLAAAEELHYIPNKLAQSMRSHSTKTIAVVVADIQNNFFGAIVAAIEQKAREKGYAVLICNSNEKRELELECLEMLASKQVDGILLASTFTDRKEIPTKYVKTVFEKFPIVTFDRKINGFPFTSVLTDNYAMAYTVTKYLIGLGHDGIATIGSEKEKAVSNTVREREEGTGQHCVKRESAMTECASQLTGRKQQRQRNGSIFCWIITGLRQLSCSTTRSSESF